MRVPKEICGARLRPLLLLVPVGFCCLAGSGCRTETPDTGSAAQTGLAEMPQLSKDSFNAASVCGTCHQAIHASWQQSMHSRSFHNGVFQAAYREVQQRFAKRHTRLCLKCHAPTVRHTRDFAAEEAITQEGITCDFCHSVRGVDLESREDPFILEVGLTKYGPLRYARSPVHVVMESEVHRRSELCAGCHEYRNEYGVPVLTTYSEWKASPYAARGKQCQDCHMPRIPGRVVALGLGTSERTDINLHDISGSHSVERVRSAVTMNIQSATRSGPNQVQVSVQVANVGSGHCFPTGLPTHRGVLEVELFDRGKPVAQRSIAFEKVLMNGRGLPISREYEAFFDARSVRNDTRLRPGERRTVSITFRDVYAPEAVVKASLWYEYCTKAVRVRPEGETIEPVEMKFLLASAQRALR